MIFRKYGLVIATVVGILLVTSIKSYAWNYRRAELLSQITGKTHYLAPSPIGHDGNNGSSGSPWATLTYALSQMSDGDGLIVAAGDYGSFTETSASGRKGYRYIIAAEDAEPKFDYIYLGYNTLTNSYLVFHGIKTYPDWVNLGVIRRAETLA